MEFNQSQKLLRPGLHFGNVSRVREIAGLIVAESEYAANSCTPLHAHETASLTMVTHGSYREQFGAHTYKCSRGTALYRAAGQAHFDWIDATGARCLMIEFNEAWRNRISSVEIPVVRQLANATCFIGRIRRELSRNDAVTPLAVESLVLEWICRFTREASQKLTIPSWLKRLRDRLETDYGKSISLGELAHDSGRHPAHVARMFRKHYHCSIGDFVRQRRIAHACESIRAGEMFSRIAIDAGFAHQAHFSRVFRDVLGFTPREYRDLARKPQAKPHRT